MGGHNVQSICCTSCGETVAWQHRISHQCRQFAIVTRWDDGSSSILANVRGEKRAREYAKQILPTNKGTVEVLLLPEVR